MALSCVLQVEAMQLVPGVSVVAVAAGSSQVRFRTYSLLSVKLMLLSCRGSVPCRSYVATSVYDELNLFHKLVIILPTGISEDTLHVKFKAGTPNAAMAESWNS
jgi:hypothetical protein